MDMRKRRKPRGGSPVQKPRPAKTVAVFVLGDIGQPPRMQYHALSLARAGHNVEFVGYKGSKPMESLLTSPKINIRYVRTLPRPTAMPQSIFYAYAPIKIVCQTFMLLWMLLVTMPMLDYMIIQNPPAIPTLAVARICTCLTDTKLIIDWHNYGYTILGLKLGEGHLVTQLAKCTHGGDIETLLTRQLTDGTVEMRKDRPMLIVSTTSWTADEDFLLLLKALAHYDSLVSKPGGIGDDAATEQLPRLAVLITGRGPLRTYYESEIDKMKLRRVQIATAWLSAEDYPLVLGSADLGVSLHTSSSGLDLPMKVVDMLGCGTPVCAYEFACIGELVTVDNGLVFSDAEALAQQIQDLACQLDTEHGTYGRLLQGAASFREIDWDTNYKSVLDLLQ
ncbi:mannosyltransferase [Coemansia sp. RSA 1200]|nr:mannosyltransferase [Coemansia sp. RSA 1200]